MLGPVQRFALLPAAEKLATAEALVVVVGTRVAVGALPRSALSQWVGRAMHEAAGEAGEHADTVGQVCRAIRRASRRVPGATCLVQALAGCSMLERRKVRAHVEVGVDKQANALSAHAWLVVGGRVVLGGEDARARFVVLEARPSWDR